MQLLKKVLEQKGLRDPEINYKQEKRNKLWSRQRGEVQGKHKRILGNRGKKGENKKGKRRHMLETMRDDPLGNHNSRAPWDD